MANRLKNAIENYNCRNNWNFGTGQLEKKGAGDKRWQGIMAENLKLWLDAVIENLELRAEVGN